MPDVAFMIGPLTETDAWSKDKSQVDILFALRFDLRFDEMFLCLNPSSLEYF